MSDKKPVIARFKITREFFTDSNVSEAELEYGENVLKDPKFMRLEFSAPEDVFDNQDTREQLFIELNEMRKAASEKLTRDDQL